MTVVLDRPHKRNAQDPQMWAALHQIGRELSGAVRVVLVRAEGPSFSAGLDRALLSDPEGIRSIGRLPEQDALATLKGYQDAFRWLGRTDLISIAAVQGHAVGAGFQLALACDLRVLADDAQLSMAEVTYGLVPDLAGTGPLVRLVGEAKALELCATGRRLSAGEAAAVGLANLVVPRAQLDEAARELAAALLASPRDAVVEVKALLRGAGSRTDDEQCEAERRAQVRRLRDLADTLE